MDNISHTLIAGAIAKSGLERATPRATAAVVLGANLPDADLLAAAFAGPGGYLVHHRGITHSWIGIAALTPLLALALYLYSRRRDAPGSRARFAPLCLAAGLGLLSHLLLDWTNAYGVRPWLPFDDRWVYADWLAIVDPWLWLVPATALYWLTARGALRHVGWGMLAAALSAVVVLSGRAPAWAIVLWLTGVGVAFLGTRWKPLRAQRAVAWTALAFVPAYWGLAAAAHDSALRVARDRIVQRSAREVAAIPTPGDPFTWRVVEYAPDSLRVTLLRLTGDEPPRLLGAFPIALDDPAAQAALTTKRARAMLTFARFPFVELLRDSEPPVVYLRDARYALTERSGWGVMPVVATSVDLPAAGSN